MDPSSSTAQWQRALQILRSQIAFGEYEAGQKLRETHIAEALGISRTPMREAMQRLEQEGLLVREKSGYTVRTFTLEEAFAAIELRGVVEGMAVRLAAEAPRDPRRLGAFQETLLAMDEVVERADTVAYDSLNSRFHAQMAGLCGLNLVEEEVLRSHRLPFAAPSAFPTRLEDKDRFHASLRVGQSQHHALFEAIAAGEGARAASLAEEHARLAKANVRAALAFGGKNGRAAPQLALVKG